MDDEASKQVQERLAELPDDIRQAILASDFEDTFHIIGTGHQLHIDQIGALGDEIMLAMLGFTDLAQLPARLSTALRVPADMAATISQEVSDKIFVPIRESMKAFAEKKSSAPAPVPAAAPKAEIHPAEKMLTAPTVTKAPPAPPPDYKTDPYREPAV